MTILRYLAWGGFVTIWLSLLVLIQYPIRKNSRIIHLLIIFIVKILLAMLLAFAVVSTDTVFSYRLGFAFTALYAALFGDAAGDLLMMPLTIRQRECTLKLQASVCSLCTAACFLFGTINMQAVTGNHLTITSEKIHHNHTLAFVSDMHVGSSQSLHTTEKTIQKLESDWTLMKTYEDYSAIDSFICEIEEENNLRRD
jgi:hypothetical protein